MKFIYLYRRHEGQNCYIVGKGASLGRLTAEYFTDDAPIICINQSIVVVQRFGLPNPIYSLQKDGMPGDMVKPNEDVILLLQDTDGYSREWFPEHPERVLIDPVIDQNFLHPSVMAIRMCINLAQYMGCSRLLLVSCDSLANGDLRTYDVNTGEAKITGAATWYQNVRNEVFDDLKGISHEFITPD